MQSSVIFHQRSLQLIDWMIECALETRASPAQWSPAAVVNKSCELLSCDEAKSPGTDRGPFLSISVTALWMFFSQWASHTQQYRTLTRPGPLVTACSSHFGTDERLIRGGSRVLLLRGSLTLTLVVIWTNVCNGRWVHAKTNTCVHYTSHFLFLSLALSLWVEPVWLQAGGCN